MSNNDNDAQLNFINKTLGTEFSNLPSARLAYYDAGAPSGSVGGGGSGVAPEELEDRVTALENRIQYLEDNIYEFINRVKTPTNSE